jgi:hypothetical protein
MWDNGPAGCYIPPKLASAYTEQHSVFAGTSAQSRTMGVEAANDSHWQGVQLWAGADRWAGGRWHKVLVPYQGTSHASSGGEGRRIDVQLLG